MPVTVVLLEASDAARPPSCHPPRALRTPHNVGVNTIIKLLHKSRWPQKGVTSIAVAATSNTLLRTSQRGVPGHGHSSERRITAHECTVTAAAGGVAATDAAAPPPGGVASANLSCEEIRGGQADMRTTGQPAAGGSAVTTRRTQQPAQPSHRIIHYGDEETTARAARNFFAGAQLLLRRQRQPLPGHSYQNMYWAPTHAATNARGPVWWSTRTTVIWNRSPHGQGYV